MSRQVFRYEVPVDDQYHGIGLTTDAILAVAVVPTAEWGATVEFWAEHDDDCIPPSRRYFQVYGTGHKLPNGARWVGTCPRTPDGLVWHLYELTF